MSDSARSVVLAQGILDVLNANQGEYITTFHAERSKGQLSPTEIEAMKDAKVFVFTGSVGTEPGGRGGFIRRFRPIVAVQKKLSGKTPETCLQESDKLEMLAEQLTVRLVRNPTIGEMSLQGFDDDQERDAFVLEAMQALNTFIAILQPQYTDSHLLK